MDEILTHPVGGQPQRGFSDPPSGAATIGPSDTVALAKPARGVYVGVSGTLKVRFIDGSVVQFTAIVPGTFYPMLISQIYSGGTSATGIIVLY